MLSTAPSSTTAPRLPIASRKLDNSSKLDNSAFATMNEEGHKHQDGDEESSSSTSSNIDYPVGASQSGIEIGDGDFGQDRSIQMCMQRSMTIRIGQGVEVLETDDEDDEKGTPSGTGKFRIVQMSSLPVTSARDIDNESTCSSSRRRSLIDILTILRRLASQKRMTIRSSFVNVLPIGSRRSSLTDISKQTSVHELFIRMDHNDNLMARVSPYFAAVLAKMYYTPAIALTMHVTVTIVGALSRWWLFAALYMVGFISILDWPLLKYMVGHSFDLYVQELCAVAWIVCATALQMDYLGQDVLRWFHHVCGNFYSIVAIMTYQCFDGYHVANWIKHIMIGIAVMAYGFYFVLELYDPQFEDILIPAPLIKQTISIRGISLIATWNIIVLFVKRIIFQITASDCILVATYPTMNWVREEIKQRIASSMDRTRTVTMSLDIYKQSLTQKLDLFLLDTRDMLHLWFTHRIAHKIQQVTCAFHFRFAFADIILHVRSIISPDSTLF